MRRAAVALVATAALLFSASASAAPPTPTTTQTTPTPTSTVPQTSPTGNGGVLSSPDTTIQLGGTDQACKNGTGLSNEVINNCISDGLAQSAFPPGNYGTDTHVDTGFTDPAGDAAALLQNITSWVFAIMAHVLTWILLGLGVAFNFDLFRSDSGGHIAKGLQHAEQLFTFPLLPIFIVIGAIVGIVYWIGQRQEGRAVVHWGAMAAMMVVGLIVISNPIGVFGWADDAANGIANGSLGAFTGSGGNTGGGFANATPALWRTTMEEPWCAMEFGDVNWCMGKIDPAMAAAKTSVLAHLPQALGDQGTPQLAAQQAPLEKLRLNDAKTNGELFLSFITNADARNGMNDTWTLYHALLNDHPELASIRGFGGVGEHLVILFLISVTGLVFLVLLIYITWQLLINSVFFVFLLLMTPVVIFAPAFGETGRGIFLKWLTWIFEALSKKIIFAIFLGVILLITSVVLSIGASVGGWLMEWFILTAVWSMAFLYRHKFLELMTAGLYHKHGHPNMMYNRSRGGYGASGAVPVGEHVINEEHTHHHAYAGDTYHQNAFVYGQHAQNGTASNPRGQDAIPGEVRELKE